MSVLLTNLVARAPSVEDFYAIAELVAACDIAEDGVADSSMRELAARWQSGSFQLESDAWVIVNNRKQFVEFVGFACIWHRDYEEFSTLICVHPQYRKRGIGTLLLRLAEQRARELMRSACPDARVSLRAVVSANNVQARSLFEREGYLAVREFWRVMLGLVEAEAGEEGAGRAYHVEKFTVDVDIESGQLVGAAPLYEREGVFNVRHFITYEKELRPAGDPGGCPDSDDSIGTLVSA
jgi:ribosomal protein S18 acetylase RimI-like enzyme